MSFVHPGDAERCLWCEWALLIRRKPERKCSRQLNHKAPWLRTVLDFRLSYG